MGSLESPDAPTLWPDGEKIPYEQLDEVFQQPPDLPAIHRSSLIIGAKGVGKTTLLRWLMKQHSGPVLWLALAPDLAAIGKEQGYGALTIELHSDEIRRIAGKAASLAAVRFAAGALERDLSVDVSALQNCIPPAVARLNRGRLNVGRLNKLHATLGERSQHEFEEIGASRSLQALVASVGRSSLEAGRGPLLLLLDRADMVSPAACTGVFQVLDQAETYTAVAAMRPGPSLASSLIDEPIRAVPGDHFDVVSLGTNPRSDAWRSFALETLGTQPQLAPVLKDIPEEVVDAVLTLARDSLRVAIDVLGAATLRSENLQELPVQVEKALGDYRANLRLSSRETLRQFLPDSNSLFSNLRQEVMQAGGQTAGPVTLTVKGMRQSTLLERAGDVDRLFSVGLRCGAFYLPEGERWAPGDQPQEVEVAPLLIWAPVDGLPGARDKGKGTKLVKSEGELMRRGGAKAVPKIFVAYRMRDKRSGEFLAQFREEVTRHPALRATAVEVVDGRVKAGELWPKEIRGRISSSRLAVGDITGMRNDVLFELGFAYGRGRPIVPVVDEKFGRSDVPRWLTEIQTASFGEEKGLGYLVSSVVDLLSGASRAKRWQAPRPVPGTAVFVRVLDWNASAAEVFSATAAREGLKWEVLKLPQDGRAPSSSIGEEAEEEDISRIAARANLLVLSVDGTQRDSLMHFLAGAVASRPKTGQQGVGRTVVVLTPDEQDAHGLVAESVSRVPEVRLVKAADMRAAVERFAKRYQSWSDRQD
jgi:hypothetical protein